MDIIFSLCHVLWLRLTTVSLVKAQKRMVYWISIKDQYSLRIVSKIRIASRTDSLRMCIQDKNSLVRTYLVNIRMGYVPREVVVSKFMPPNIAL